MARIVLASDNHGDTVSINKILSDNPQADYYLHCGDCCVDPKRIEPFVTVCGNNDWQFKIVREKIIEIEGHKILIIHGNGYTYSFSNFANYVKSKGCDICFFGHTHVFFNEEIEGITFVNPGSTYYNRNYDDPTYAIVELTKENISVKKMYI